MFSTTSDGCPVDLTSPAQRGGAGNGGRTRPESEKPRTNGLGMNAGKTRAGFRRLVLHPLVQSNPSQDSDPRIWGRVNLLE